MTISLELYFNNAVNLNVFRKNMMNLINHSYKRTQNLILYYLITIIQFSKQTIYPASNTVLDGDNC